MPYTVVLQCMHYVLDVCNKRVTVYYGEILVCFGIDYILQGAIELH